MGRIEILLQHGWGWDAGVWAGWRALAPPGVSLLVVDRGYFGTSLTPGGDPRVVVAHSFGLHLLEPRWLEGARLAVVLGGFQAFHPEEEGAGRRSRRLVGRMRRRLDREPNAVLAEFRARCLAPETGLCPLCGEVDQQLLAEDLEGLDSQVLGLSALRAVPRVLLLHGEEDRIVPVERARALHRQLPNSRLELVAGAGHALPLTRPAACWARILEAWGGGIMSLPERDDLRKARIAHGFARGATTYDQRARPQQRAAQVVLAEVARSGAQLPPGPVLEIGCGTGGLSAGLARLLPGREIWFTDLSGELLEACRRRVGCGPDARRLHWEVMDGETGPEQGRYALIVSGMALHWFADWAGALQRWLGALGPGGVLLCSFQEAGSFPEWREQCRRQGLPCTANPFPVLEQVQAVLGGGRCWVQEEVGRYTSARAFFRSLKDTGTATSLGGGSLGAGAFRRLLRAWDLACPEGVEVRVRCGFAVAQQRG